MSNDKPVLPWFSEDGVGLAEECPVRMRSRAIPPFSAVDTLQPSRVSMRAISLRVSGSSSTTSTRSPGFHPLTDEWLSEGVCPGEISESGSSNPNPNERREGSSTKLGRMVLSEDSLEAMGGVAEVTVGEDSGVVSGTEGVGSVPVEESPIVRVNIFPSSSCLVDISTRPSVSRDISTW